MTVADIIRAAVDGSPKTQKRIAAESGFKNANVISMLKCGVTRLPIARAPSLAHSLGLDSRELLRACIREYSPDEYQALSEAFDIDLTADEIRIIHELRRVSRQLQIAALSDVSRGLLNEFLSSLRAESHSLHRH